jgi:hypothetical protein
MPTSRLRAIEILRRQLNNRTVVCGIVLSAESQLTDLEALLEDCRHRRATADDSEAAKLANVEVTAHKCIALLRQELGKSKPEKPLAGLSDDELQDRRLKLVEKLTGAK